MSFYKSKSRGSHDLYLMYPYKKNPPQVGSTIPVPYVKLSDVSNHKYSLTYAQWSVVIEDVVMMIVDRLKQGQVWKIGSGLGSLEIVRVKAKTFLDRIKSKEEGRQVKMLRNDYDNQMLIPEWRRTNEPFSQKWLWRFKMIPDILKSIYDKCDVDYTYIYKFRQK